MKFVNIVVEKLKIGILLRSLHGVLCNYRYPEYNLFDALALKSGLPGADDFYFFTEEKEVKLVPYGQHLDQHDSHITDMQALRNDFEGENGKINWITKNKLLKGKTLSEFVTEGPVRMHFLPDARCLAAGGGRNRLMTLMRLGYKNAKQLKQATWDEEKKRYFQGDIVINSPGKPVWDDIPPGTTKQGWVDKTKRWDDAYRQGLRLTMGEVYNAIFKN